MRKTASKSMPMTGGVVTYGRSLVRSMSRAHSIRVFPRARIKRLGGMTGDPDAEIDSFAKMFGFPTTRRSSRFQLVRVR